MTDAQLTEIFMTNPPIPAINGEPYYDGMENLEGGSDEAACVRPCMAASSPEDWEATSTALAAGTAASGAAR